MDAAYALAVEERVLAAQAIDRNALVSDFEEQLAEPLSDEVSVEDLERAYRVRQARENLAAQDRLMGMMGMAGSAREAGR